MPSSRLFRLSWRVLIAMLVAACLAFCALSLDWRRGESLSAQTTTVRASGPLSVGVGHEPFVLPPEVTVGGFPPPRPVASNVQPELGARAMVLQVGAQRFGVVLLDLLLVTQPLVERIRQAVDFPTWVAATHTHSGPGQFDPNVIAQVAALGRHDREVEAAIVKSASRALKSAGQQLQRASVTVARVQTDTLATPRSSDAVDQTLTQLSFRDASTDGTLADWIITSAHPTLSPRGKQTLSGDYPLFVRSQSHPLTFVFQGSAGNATTKGETVENQQRRIEQALVTIQATPLDIQNLTLSTTYIPLPTVDTSRLVPSFLAPALRTLFGLQLARTAELQRLQLGDFSVLAVPFEPSYLSGLALKGAGQSQALISLTNGYFGYLEPPDVVMQNKGESARQYFVPQLLTDLERALRQLEQ
jgi:neutral ceramidase